MSHSPRFCSPTPSFSRFNRISIRFCSATDARPRGAASRLRPGLAYLVLILAALLLSASASAQVTYTGTAATQNFGSQAVGSAEAAVTLNFSVAAGTTVGSIDVLTQGAPNLDFTSASGGTCTAQAYSAAATCTVNVTFNPKSPGLRRGAVVFFSEAGDAGTSLGQVLIYGTGTGPQATFSNSTTGPHFPGSTTNLGSGFSEPSGIAVDASGNVFVADTEHDEVKEIVAAGGYTTTNTLNGGFHTPRGVAVDGAGNVFVVDELDSVVKEIVAAGGYTTVTNLGSGFANPSGVAVDGAGNIFVAGNDDNLVHELVAAGGYTTDNILGSGFANPYGIAVDAIGNLFVADMAHNAVKEIVAAGGYTTINTLGGGFNEPVSAAVDASDNVYVGDYGDKAVYEILATGGYTTVKILGEYSSGLYGVSGVAVDGSGNVFANIVSDQFIEKLDYADPPSLTFANTELGIESSDSPQTVTVSNNGNSALAFTALAYPADFLEASGDTHACTSTTTLQVGGSCDLPIEFDPANSGTLSEAVTLSDDSLNNLVAQQSIAVSGTSVEAVGGAIKFLVTPSSSAPVYAGTSFSITITALNSSNQTAAYNGTVSFASSDPEFVNPGPLTLSNGTGQATVTLQTPGTQTITATDTTSSTLTGSGSFNVVSPPPVTFTGTTASVNFGSQAVGSAEVAVTLNFSIAAGTTVGSIGVLTQGAPDLDFTSASGGTCTAQAYATAATCTVKVTFKPKFPGARRGAVVFFSEAGDAGTSLLQVMIYGTGVGPQVNFGSTTSGVYFPVSESTLGTDGFVESGGLAVDGSGNVFVADIGDGMVKEILAAGGYTVVNTLGNGFANGSGVAVDGAGNVFVADAGDKAVLEIVAAGGYATVNTVGSGFSQPYGVAVDGSGNVFVADPGNNAVKEIVAAGGYTTIETLGGGFSKPLGVAVGVGGNIFVVDTGNNAVKEIPASCIAGANDSTCVRTLDSGFLYPVGLTVDGSGNIFVAVEGDDVKEILAAGGYTTIKTLGEYGARGVAVDGSGNVFLAIGNGNAVTKLDFVDPPTLTFMGTTVGVASSDSPQTVTVINDGNAALTFPVPSDGDNPVMSSGFTLDASSTCPQLNSSSTAGTLAAGASCTYAVDYVPVAAGEDFGALLPTDNSMNLNPAVTQIIELTGYAIEPHLAFTTPPPATLKSGKAPGTVVVSALDASNDNLVSSFSGTITLTVTGPSSYSRVYTATASSGIATFSGFASLHVPGSYSYTATDTPDGLTQAVAIETLIPQPPFGDLGPAEDNVTFSTTVGQSDSVNISGWVVDPQDGAPLSNVKVYIDGTSIGAPTLGIARPDVAAAENNEAYLLCGYDLLYSASSLSLGTHQVTVVAIDSSGLSTTFGPRTFTVAATAGVGSPFGDLGPAVDSVTGSTTVSPSHSVKIVGWVADPTDGAPLSNVTVYIDSISVGTPTLGIARPDVAAAFHNAAYTNSGFKMLYPATSLTAGAHVVTVVAIDSGGRSTTLRPVEFTVQ